MEKKLDDLVEFYLEREGENFEFLERDDDDRVAGSCVLCVLMLRTQRQLTTAGTSGS